MINRNEEMWKKKSFLISSMEELQAQMVNSIRCPWHIPIQLSVGYAIDFICSYLRGHLTGWVDHHLSRFFAITNNLIDTRMFYQFIRALLSPVANIIMFITTLYTREPLLTGLQQLKHQASPCSSMFWHFERFYYCFLERAKWSKQPLAATQ